MIEPFLSVLHSFIYRYHVAAAPHRLWGTESLKLKPFTCLYNESNLLIALILQYPPVFINIPAGIWCQNDVVLTSMRRYDVASTLIRRHFHTKCPLGLLLLSEVDHSFIVVMTGPFLLEKQLLLNLSRLNL